VHAEPPRSPALSDVLGLSSASVGLHITSMQFERAAGHTAARRHVFARARLQQGRGLCPGAKEHSDPVRQECVRKRDSTKRHQMDDPARTVFAP